MVTGTPRLRAHCAGSMPAHVRGRSGLSQGAGDSRRGCGLLSGTARWGCAPGRPNCPPRSGLNVVSPVPLAGAAPDLTGPRRGLFLAHQLPHPPQPRARPYLREGAVWLELLGGGTFPEGA